MYSSVSVDGGGEDDDDDDDDDGDGDDGDGTYLTGLLHKELLTRVWFMELYTAAITI